jgi:hypothetical protein
MKSVIREYRQEIFVAVLALLGLLVMLNRKYFESWMAVAPQQALESARTLNEQVGASLRAWLDGLGTWGLAGLGVGVLALAYLIWRIRYRFTHTESLQATVCPRCGGELHRIHRSWLDRFLSATLLPTARRYQCANKDCRWEGLRRRKHHHIPDIDINQI